MNLITIKGLKDGSIVRGLLNYPTESDALAAMYYELWYATSDKNTIGLVCVIMGDDGIVVKREEYTKLTDATAEPAEEETE